MEQRKWGEMVPYKLSGYSYTKDSREVVSQKKIIRKYLRNIYSLYIYNIISIMHQQRPPNMIHIWGVKTWYYKGIKGDYDINIICGSPTVWYYKLIIKTTLFDALCDWTGSVCWIIQFILIFEHQQIRICVV